MRRLNAAVSHSASAPPTRSLASSSQKALTQNKGADARLRRCSAAQALTHNTGSGAECIRAALYEGCSRVALAPLRAVQGGRKHILNTSSTLSSAPQRSRDAPCACACPCPGQAPPAHPTWAWRHAGHVRSCGHAAAWCRCIGTLGPGPCPSSSQQLPECKAACRYCVRNNRPYRIWLHGHSFRQFAGVRAWGVPTANFALQRPAATTAPSHKCERRLRLYRGCIVPAQPCR